MDLTVPVERVDSKQPIGPEKLIDHVQSINAVSPRHFKMDAINLDDLVKTARVEKYRETDPE